MLKFIEYTKCNVGRKTNANKRKHSREKFHTKRIMERATPDNSYMVLVELNINLFYVGTVSYNPINYPHTLAISVMQNKSV